MKDTTILKIYVVITIVWLSVFSWIGSCGIFAQGLGFELRGPVSFGGFLSGNPVWTIGKGMHFVTPDPSLHRRFAELEGQTIVITVERASK